MARKKIINRIVVRDEDGKPVEVPMGEVVDFGEPQADEETGRVPEFVNISSKVQLLCVPNDEMNTITVPRYGILKGAQWRHMSKRNDRVWGPFPFFVERVATESGYDSKYLLTERQMIDEIERLAKRKRIRELMENSVIKGDDTYTPKGFVQANRSREDRPAVMDAAMRQIMKLEELDLKRRKELGIMEEGAY